MLRSWSVTNPANQAYTELKKSALDFLLKYCLVEDKEAEELVRIYLGETFQKTIIAHLKIKLEK